MLRSQGQFDEALRRRREAELSRAQLQQKIEAFKRRRGREDPAMGDPPDGSGGRGTPANGSAEQTKAAAARARAEAAHRREMQRKDAEDRVCLSAVVACGPVGALDGTLAQWHVKILCSTIQIDQR